MDTVPNLLSDEQLSAVVAENRWRGLSGPSEPTPLTAYEVRQLAAGPSDPGTDPARRSVVVEWAEEVRRSAAALRNLLAGHARVFGFRDPDTPRTGTGRTSLADRDPQLPGWRQAVDPQDPLSAEEFDRIVLATIESLDGATDDQVHAVANWARLTRTNVLLLALVLNDRIEIVRFDGRNPVFQHRHADASDASGAAAS